MMNAFILHHYMLASLLFYYSAFMTCFTGFICEQHAFGVLTCLVGRSSRRNTGLLGLSSMAAITTSSKALKFIWAKNKKYFFPPTQTLCCFGFMGDYIT